MVLFTRLVSNALVAIAMMIIAGCGDDTETVRKIQSQRQVRMQSQTQQDHLAEVFRLLSRLIELNSIEANRQITYHLNRWHEDRQFNSQASVPALVGSISDVLSAEQASERIARQAFMPSDVEHLRDSYLFNQVVKWVDHPHSDDPLLEDWWPEVEKSIGQESTQQLRTAARLFDWTMRNVAYEPPQPTDPAPESPPMSLGMTFRGPGYRQTDYQAIWRGTGDSLQRAGVFTLLCRQAGIPAFVLATPSAETGQLDFWCVGVLVDKQIYLFEPELATYIPGPGQIGIATLADARSDASVMRRLNVPGFFDYPRSKSDIQQCVALLNVMPEAISQRMKQLESGLTGDRRMITYVDSERLAEQIDAIGGIAGVRLWRIPLLAEVYAQDIEKAAARDPVMNFWYVSRWATLEAPVGKSRELALARWRHLHGQFDNDEQEDKKGARVLYLAQRAPEFEIQDLRINVDLQKAYGIRRELGTTTDVYDRQVQQAQALMRRGKQNATYWISLIQYDDQQYETAATWFAKRVLEPSQLNPRAMDFGVHWEPAARYNLARTKERLSDLDRAIELYKTDGDPQEHGNRIRARLLSKSSDE